MTSDKIKLLRLAHAWPRDTVQCNRSQRILVFFIVWKPGISKAISGEFREKNGTSSHMWVPDLWRQIFFFLPLFIIAFMIFTSYFPGHLIRITVPVLPRSRVQVSEAPLLTDSDTVRRGESMPRVLTWGPERFHLSPSYSFGVNLGGSGTSLQIP